MDGLPSRGKAKVTLELEERIKFVAEAVKRLTREENKERK